MNSAWAREPTQTPCSRKRKIQVILAQWTMCAASCHLWTFSLHLVISSCESILNGTSADALAARRRSDRCFTNQMGTEGLGPLGGGLARAVLVWPARWWRYTVLWGRGRGFRVPSQTEGCWPWQGCFGQMCRLCVCVCTHVGGDNSRAVLWF